MPSRSFHYEQRDCARADAFADFNQMLVHGFDVDGGQRQGGADASDRTDCAEKIHPVEAPVAQRARTASESRPDAGQRSLPTDPCFILEPDFDRLASTFAERFLGDDCEVFSKASWAAGSYFGCCGRTERRRKPSLRSNLPTLRSCRLTPNSAVMRLRRSTRRNLTTPSRARSAPSPRPRMKTCPVRPNSGWRAGLFAHDR
jgi:hypothetical protein